MTDVSNVTVADTQQALASLFAGEQDGMSVQSEEHHASPANVEDSHDGELNYGSDPQNATNNGLGQPRSAPNANAMVPSSRLKQEADRARKAEAQIATMQTQFNQLMAQNAEMQGWIKATQQQVQSQAAPQSQKQQPVVQLPELVDDPIGYANKLLHAADQVATAAIRREIEAAQINMVKQKTAASSLTANARYGADLVKEATAYATQVGKKEHFLSQTDPVGSACDWYLQEVAAHKYGRDPVSIRNAVEAELLQSPAFAEKVATALRTGRAPQAQGQQSALPPSFSGAPRGSNDQPGALDSMAALNALFAQNESRMTGSGPQTRA